MLNPLEFEMYRFFILLWEEWIWLKVNKLIRSCAGEV